jgi:ferredoxin
LIHVGGSSFAEAALETGVCHTCQCGLVDGEVAYVPDPLGPPKDGRALICCNHPTSDVAREL